MLTNEYRLYSVWLYNTQFIHFIILLVCDFRHSYYFINFILLLICAFYSITNIVSILLCIYALHVCQSHIRCLFYYVYLCLVFHVSFYLISFIILFLCYLYHFIYITLQCISIHFFQSHQLEQQKPLEQEEAEEGNYYVLVCTRETLHIGLLRTAYFLDIVSTNF